MSRDADYIVKDEKARKAFEKTTGKHISYGRFRILHPDLVPSKNRKGPVVARYARNFDSPHRKGGTFQAQLNAEDDERIAELFKKGYTIQQLANEFRVTVQTITGHLRKMGIRSSGGHAEARDWTEAETETLRRMYFKGIPQDEIAEALGRSMGSVHSRISKCGLAKIKCKKEKSRHGTAIPKAASKN